MTTTTAFFSATEDASLPRRPLSSAQWTALGALSIPLWALWPSLALHIRNVPLFEALATMFGCGFLTFRALGVGSREPPSAATLRGWLPSFVYATAVVGGDLTFLLATHRLPAAQANLLSYLWPVMIGVLGAAVGLFRLGVRQIAGLLLGFGGAVILMWDGHIVPSVSGSALALTSGALWASYCVFRLAWKEPTGNLLARGCGIAALFCATTHFAIEPTVMPSGVTLAAMVIAGVLPMGVGYYLWDRGFQQGDSHRLAVMAYATPLCSSLLLAAWGAAMLTWNLLAGALVIVAAGMLSRSGTTRGSLDK